MKRYVVIWRSGGTAKWEWHKTFDVYVQADAERAAKRVAEAGYEARAVEWESVRWDDASKWGFEGPEL